MNSATCLEYSNVTLYEMQVFDGFFSYENASGFLCQCVPGFRGLL